MITQFADRPNPAMAHGATMSLTTDLVALCHRDVLEPPRNPDLVRFTDADYDRVPAEVLARLGDDPIWVALRYMPASHAAVIVSAEGVFGAMAASIFLGERISFLALLGAALMLAAIVHLAFGSAPRLATARSATYRRTAFTTSGQIPSRFPPGRRTKSLIAPRCSRTIPHGVDGHEASLGNVAFAVQLGRS